ncbi:alpha/beta fold hydrolase [Alteromonas sediminis]|uniref:Alpha/beta fold hydrolase n=1 Tax=Alteromonas sediminis TaxID=2259342 RepID=A0A3N5XZ82_9ALTE|nr:alpha/beta fold hydrolase [Alteromonas sediminis]RPJ66352.1 alpha/beta fold hydrolase [Alteromonas sediminis]
MSWNLTEEQALESGYFSHINAFWQNHVVLGQFIGEENIELHFAYCIPENPKGAIVLCNGRVETFLKYKEVIYDFYQNGFACFTLDHRGQGLSGRMTQDPQHGYVKHFAHYVDDLCTFVSNIVQPQWKGDLSLVCHSMGGAIGALTLLHRPELFERAVFCSPMFGIKPSLPDWAATAIVEAGLKINRIRNRESGYFFGQKPYTVYPFQVNPLTHSKVRYECMVELYKDTPALQLGGVTTEWLAAAKDAMNEIELRAFEISQPVLVFSSARDIIIDNKRQRIVAATMPSGELVKVAHARHELLMERDDIRNPVLARIMDFLSQ